MWRRLGDIIRDAILKFTRPTKNFKFFFFFVINSILFFFIRLPQVTLNIQAFGTSRVLSFFFFEIQKNTCP